MSANVAALAASPNGFFLGVATQHEKTFVYFLFIYYYLITIYVQEETRVEGNKIEFDLFQKFA